MISQYINVFGIKWAIVMLLICIMSIFWLYKAYFTDWKRITRSNKLKVVGTGIVIVNILLMIIFSIVLVLAYGENVSNNMFGIIAIWETVIALFGGIFNLFYEKELNDKTYSQFGRILLWIGIISFIGLVIYYFRWIA